MGKLVLMIYNFGLFLHNKKIPVLPTLIKFFIRIVFGPHIGMGAKFGKGSVLGYGGIGVVIHDRAVIGKNVSIGQNVTIGGTSKKYEVPVIGDNCELAAGAVIVGPVTIGKDCVIGANAVVVKDIPDNSVAVGVPARVIKSGININDYR
ncbi:MAG TPA: serine acetyltransferase [Campylobacterales bacterium]|nr:serine acetyltransferase [Campylobacterales bacterium]